MAGAAATCGPPPLTPPTFEHLLGNPRKDKIRRGTVPFFCGRVSRHYQPAPEPAIMKRFLAILGLALLILIVVLCVRASTVKSRQVTASQVTDLAVDANAAAGRLAGALRFPTVSYEDGANVEAQAFLDLHRYLEQSFPKA